MRLDLNSTSFQKIVRRNLPFIFPLILGSGCGVIIVIAFAIAVIIPNSHARIPMNHMRTSHSAVEIIAAERLYAAKFPEAGFTCDLHQLEQAGLVDEVLASGERAGYHYELHGCDSTAPATAFLLTAVPIAQGRTGEVAFCANQEGVLWYAHRGSVDDCFRARSTWALSDQPIR